MSTSFGLTAGVLCHYWYNFLDRLLPGRAVRTVAKKVIFDQVIFSPICISICLVIAGLLEGNHRQEIYKDLAEKGK